MQSKFLMDKKNTPVAEVIEVKMFENSSPVSFVLNRGESVCIFGMNGSGKTMFINAFCGLMRPFSGLINIYVDYLNRGVCPQFPEHLIFKETVYEEALIITGRADKAAELLSELKINGEQSPFNLSDGEKRLLFMNGLLKSKQLLIFDEPFSSLDNTSKEKTIKAIATGLSSGKSLIYTANREKDTAFADKVIVSKLLDNNCKLL